MLLQSNEIIHQLVDSSTKQGVSAKQGSHTSPEEEQNQQSWTSIASDSLLCKFKPTISSQIVLVAFQKLKEAKLANVPNKGYTQLKQELSCNPTRRRHYPFTSSGETITRTELLVVPSKQYWWSTKFDEFKKVIQLEFFWNWLSSTALHYDIFSIFSFR